MKCSKFRAQNEMDAKFCTACGTELPKKRSAKQIFRLSLVPLSFGIATVGLLIIVSSIVDSFASAIPMILAEIFLCFTVGTFIALIRGKSIAGMKNSALMSLPIGFGVLIILIVLLATFDRGVY